MCFFGGERGVGSLPLFLILERLGLSGLSFPGIRYHRVVELNVEGLTEDFDSSLIEVSEAGNVILVIKNIFNYES